MTTTKKIALAAAALITLAAAPAARADDGALSFGGGTLCMDLLVQSRSIWETWVDGYWSGMNSNGPSDSAWTGQEMQTDDLYRAVVVECRKNSRASVQHTVNTVYARSAAKAAPTS